MSGIYSEFLELAQRRGGAHGASVQDRRSRLRAADARAQHNQQPVKPLHSSDLTGRNDRAPHANACTHRCSISAASL